jgi:hypothetical protein
MTPTWTLILILLQPNGELVRETQAKDLTGWECIQMAEVHAGKIYANFVCEMEPK